VGRREVYAALVAVSLPARTEKKAEMKVSAFFSF
jgi:hypothetical protein